MKDIKTRIKQLFESFISEIIDTQTDEEFLDTLYKYNGIEMMLHKEKLSYKDHRILVKLLNELCFENNSFEHTMVRRTERDENGVAFVKGYSADGTIIIAKGPSIELLAQYEDTGLTPDEIRSYLKR